MRSLLIVPALLFLASCSGISPISIPSAKYKMSGNEAQELLNRLYSRDENLTSIRGLYKVKTDTPTENQSFRIAIVGDKRSENLRIEALPVTGFYSLYTVNINRYQAAFKDSDGYVTYKEVTREEMAKTIGIPFIVEDIWVLIKAIPSMKGTVWNCFKEKLVGVCVLKLDPNVEREREIVFTSDGEKVLGIDLYVKGDRFLIRYLYESNSSDYTLIKVYMPQKFSQVSLTPQKLVWNEEIESSVFTKN